MRLSSGDTELFSKYDSNTLLKTTNKEASNQVYILLSIILNIFHIKHIDWNAFNTSTKLIDYCLYQDYSFTIDESNLIKSAVTLEFYCIDHYLINS